MKTTIGILLITTSLAAQAVTSTYEYEQYDAQQYQAQTRAQARELDALADAAAAYKRANDKAIKAHQKQEQTFSALRHREESLARSKAFITEYPSYSYQLTISEADTKAVLK